LWLSKILVWHGGVGGQRLDAVHPVSLGGVLHPNLVVQQGHVVGVPKVELQIVVIVEPSITGFAYFGFGHVFVVCGHMFLERGVVVKNRLAPSTPERLRVVGMNPGVSRERGSGFEGLRALRAFVEEFFFRW